MAVATVMAGQCGQVGQGQRVDKYDACVNEGYDNNDDARTLMTKERDGNLIPPGDAAQRNR
jgi:hypothetical protein